MFVEKDGKSKTAEKIHESGLTSGVFLDRMNKIFKRYRETGKVRSVYSPEGVRALPVLTALRVFRRVFLLQKGERAALYQEKSILMDASAMDRTLMRIAHEILERCEGDLLLLGVKRRGLPLARQLASNIEAVSGRHVEALELDPTAFRDDLPARPAVPAPQGRDVTGKTVILVDDVLYTGRTIRAAMEAVISAGRPQGHPAGRFDRPGPPGAAHPARLRWQKHPHLPSGTD